MTNRNFFRPGKGQKAAGTHVRKDFSHLIIKLEPVFLGLAIIPGMISVLDD